MNNDELTPAELSLLASYRAHAGPSTDAEERIRAAVVPPAAAPPAWRFVRGYAAGALSAAIVLLALWLGGQRTDRAPAANGERASASDANSEEPRLDWRRGGLERTSPTDGAARPRTDWKTAVRQRLEANRARRNPAAATRPGARRPGTSTRWPRPGTRAPGSRNAPSTAEPTDPTPDARRPGARSPVPAPALDKDDGDGDDNDEDDDSPEAICERERGTCLESDDDDSCNDEWRNCTVEITCEIFYFEICLPEFSEADCDAEFHECHAHDAQHFAEEVCYFRFDECLETRETGDDEPDCGLELERCLSAAEML